MNGPDRPLRRILVLGATSQVGFFLIPLLAQRGMEVAALTRKRDHPGSSLRPEIRWRTYSPQALSASLADAGRYDGAVCLDSAAMAASNAFRDGDIGR